MVTDLDRYRFTSDEYSKMTEAGIFDEDSPVELIGGEVIWMAAQGHRHAALLDRLTKQLVRLLDDRVVLWPQSTLHLGEGDDPEPDLVMLRFDDYMARPPASGDALLVIEVAETTVDKDRRVKAPLYARHRIPEYWIVDISAASATVTVYREPQADGYHSIQVVRRGEPLSPQTFPELVLDTNTLLG